MSGFKPYPAYKDSGVEWLGKVPENWVLHKLKYIVRFSGGGTPSRENLTYWNGDIPWVSPKDMKVEKITGAEESITVEGLSNSTTSLMPPGTILIVVRSGILKHTIPVAITTVEVALNQDMKALQFDTKDALSEFFLRWVQGFNRDILQAWLKQGATVESVEHEYLADTIIPMPCVAEQTQIARFLDQETARIDALIEEQKRLIELLKEKRQAVISHAVTKGLDLTVAMKDSGVEWLGEVPAHWELTVVKYVVRSMGQGWSPQCDNYPAEDDEWGVLKVGCVNGGTFNPAENKRLPDELGVDTGLAIKKGDLLISRANTRELVGSTAVALSDYPRLILCDKLYRLRLSDEKIAPEFLALYLGSSAPRSQIELAASGASDSMQNISQSVVMDMPLSLPPFGEQKTILRILGGALKGFDELVAEVTAQRCLLQERRSALISAAVTGKIDVRGWQPPDCLKTPELQQEAV